MWSPIFVLCVLHFFFISAISAFIVLISSASFSTHFPRVFRYTFILFINLHSVRLSQLLDLSF